MATSYANAGGTGNRTSSITVTTNITPEAGAVVNLIDGNKTANATYAFAFTVDEANRFITFDFGVSASKIIDEMSWFGQDGANNNGTWKVSGSQNNSDWTDLGSSFVLYDDPPPVVITCTNTNGYRYYRLLQISGVTLNQRFQTELEFKIDDWVPQNYTKTLTETFISADTIQRAPARTFAEILKSNDSILKAATKVFAEIIKSSDTITRAFTRVWTETIIALEVANKNISIFFEEIAIASDNIAKGFTRTFTDTIISNDTFSQFLKWLRETHIAGIWNKISRTTSTWGKDTKTNSTWNKKYG